MSIGSESILKILKFNTRIHASQDFKKKWNNRFWVEKTCAEFNKIVTILMI